MTALAASCAVLAVLGWSGALSTWAERRRLVRRPLRRPLRGTDGGDRPRAARGSRRRQARRRLEVCELVDAVAAELAAGSVWEVAVRRAAAGTAGELAGRLTEAADVRHALVLAADLPGAEALRALNAVGALSEQTGAAAAQLVDRVGAAIRAETRSRRAVEVELAPALATTRLLAGLPLVGLLMGGALGADTVHVLVRTRPGLACFAVAAGLEVAGLLWCRAIRRRAVG